MRALPDLQVAGCKFHNAVPTIGTDSVSIGLGTPGPYNPRGTLPSMTLVSAGVLIEWPAIAGRAAKTVLVPFSNIAAIVYAHPPPA